MARNWSNPTFDGTLEDATADAIRTNRFVSLIGMEVEGVSSWVRGERRVLKPQFDSIGVPPQIGELVHLGGTLADWRVMRVAQANHRTDCKIEIRDEQGTTLR